MSDTKIVIVVSSYNSFVTDGLLNGARKALQSRGLTDEDFEVIRVPGSFEIPQAARKVAEVRKPDAIICLGAVLRGETLHFELISNECARGIQQVAADYGIPVTFGVITADTEEQAIARSGENEENKGWEAALAALDLANLYKTL
jgi:6,7-dimethyl-8-ribityllumazine synthase